LSWGEKGFWGELSGCPGGLLGGYGGSFGRSAVSLQYEIRRAPAEFTEWRC
jgi:hypothetical protein